MSAQGAGTPGGHAPVSDETFRRVVGEVRRSLAEFLAVPTAIIVGALLLAVCTTALDRAAVEPLGPVGALLRRHVFNDAQATAELLRTIAGGLITVVSITFSLVLLAVQQAAGSLTFQVVDQFLRRRLNQVTFGFFVGLALYALVILATVSPPFNPVYGATLALLLTAVALYLLLLLLYTTINQMRPTEIVETIHDHALAARARQLALVRKTRRFPRQAGGPVAAVKATRRGFVVGVDVDAIAAAAAKGGDVEVVLCVSVGSYVAYDDTLAEIRGAEIRGAEIRGAEIRGAELRGPAADDGSGLEDVVRRAVALERQRELDGDPAYGIEQLVTIAWTSISTSKQDPSPGLLVAYTLRDLLARWAADHHSGDRDPADDEPGPVVYTDDVFSRLMGAFESLAVVSTESMQHQLFAEVARGFAIMFERLPAEDLVLRIIPGVGDHVLTADLDDAMSSLAEALDRAGRAETAAAVRAARTGLADTVGKLNSRATRVPPKS